MKLLPERQDAAWKEFFNTHPSDAERLILGRARNGSVGLDLKDAKGKSIRLQVLPEGEPVLQFLDADGKVTKEIGGK